MPGQSLDKNDILALRDNPPEGVVDILSRKKGEYHNTIGIVIDNKTTVDEIKQWVISRLAAHNNLPENEVRYMIKFQPRTWFDGPVSIQIISKSNIEKISEFFHF